MRQARVGSAVLLDLEETGLVIIILTSTSILTLRHEPESIPESFSARSLGSDAGIKVIDIRRVKAL